MVHEWWTLIYWGFLLYNIYKFNCNSKKYSIGYKYTETAKKWIFYINEGKKYNKLKKKNSKEKNEILTIEDIPNVENDSKT